MKERPHQCAPVTLNEGEKYLWYSQKMSQRIHDISAKSFLDLESPNYHVFYKTRDGDVVEVTDVTQVPSSSCEWDDMQFLGVGVFSHLEKIQIPQGRNRTP